MVLILPIKGFVTRRAARRRGSFARRRDGGKTSSQISARFRRARPTKIRVALFGDLFYERRS
jgi:hypothetical protein